MWHLRLSQCEFFLIQLLLLSKYLKKENPLHPLEYLRPNRFSVHGVKRKTMGVIEIHFFDGPRPSKIFWENLFIFIYKATFREGFDMYVILKN